jgi:hypothetical protein
MNDQNAATRLQALLERTVAAQACSTRSQVAID